MGFFSRKKKVEEKEKTHIHSWGEINPDGRQYCIICNEAHYVEMKCHHKFSIIEKKKIVKVYPNGAKVEDMKYVSQCIHCGKIEVQTI